MRTYRRIVCDSIADAEVTSSWIDIPDDAYPTYSVEGINAEPATFAAAAENDVADVLRADCIVSFTGGGGGRGGRHVEFGIGVATGKRLVIVGERENVFHTLPQVEISPDIDTFVWNELLGGEKHVHVT